MSVRLPALMMYLLVSTGSQFPIASQAQDTFGQSLRNMSPNERQQVQKEYFSNLPESQQQRLRDNQRKFKSLSGTQQRELCQQFKSQAGYVPPACASIMGN